MTERIQLEQTGRHDIVFDGKEIASATSNHRGEKKRWTELKVFKTDAGRYIVQTLGLSKIPGEITRSKVVPVDDINDIPNVLGIGYLAKEIYHRLKLMIERID